MQTENLDKNVDFSIIRYSNCWEDADLLIEAFKEQSMGKYLSICSAGDNSFSLLTLDPELVVAVDLNDTQLYLAELKIEAIRLLDLEGFKAFIGIQPSENRWELYQKSIRPKLSVNAQNYWDFHQKVIETGVSNCGKFEKYFGIFRRYILKLIHSKASIQTLFEEKSVIEQAKFYDRKWNNKRWKLLFKLFFSKKVMGKVGRDPEFLKHVQVPVSEYIYQKAQKHLMTRSSQSNYMLQHIMTGCYFRNVPHYLRPENYTKIRTRIDRVKLYKGYAQNAIESYGPFDGMNLSDIFEYQDEEIFAKVADELATGLKPEGRICYWNLMVPRRLSRVHASLSYQEALSQKLTAKDQGFFYNQFIVDQKNRD